MLGFAGKYTVLWQMLISLLVGGRGDLKNLLFASPAIFDGFRIRYEMMIP